MLCHTQWNLLLLGLGLSVISFLRVNFGKLLGGGNGEEEAGWTQLFSCHYPIHLSTVFFRQNHRSLLHTLNISCCPCPTCSFLLTSPPSPQTVIPNASARGYLPDTMHPSCSCPQRQWLSLLYTCSHSHISPVPFFPRSADGRSLCPCCRMSHSSVSSLLLKNAGGERCLGLDWRTTMIGLDRRSYYEQEYSPGVAHSSLICCWSLPAKDIILTVDEENWNPEPSLMLDSVYLCWKNHLLHF